MELLISMLGLTVAWIGGRLIQELRRLRRASEAALRAEAERSDNFDAAIRWRNRALSAEAKVTTLQHVLEAHGPFGKPGCTMNID